MDGGAAYLPRVPLEEARMCKRLIDAVSPYGLSWKPSETIFVGGAYTPSGFLVQGTDSKKNPVNQNELSQALHYAFDAVETAEKSFVATNSNATAFPMKNNGFPLKESCWIDASTIRHLVSLPQDQATEACTIFGEAFKEGIRLDTVAKLKKLAADTVQAAGGKLSFTATDGFDNIKMDGETEHVGPGYIITKELAHIDPARGQHHLFKERLHTRMDRNALHLSLWKTLENEKLDLGVDLEDLKITHNGVWVSDDIAKSLVAADPQLLHDALAKAFAPQPQRSR